MTQRRRQIRRAQYTETCVERFRMRCLAFQHTVLQGRERPLCMRGAAYLQFQEIREQLTIVVAQLMCKVLENGGPHNAPSKLCGAQNGCRADQPHTRAASRLWTEPIPPPPAIP